MIQDQYSGPEDPNTGKPIGARGFRRENVDLAVVVLKIEPRTLPQSIAKQIGPPIRQMRGKKN